MSEQKQERETEVVAGAIGSTIKKKEGTWQVEIDTGQANPRRLWTKDAVLVKALDEKFGQHGAFVCHASYWTNREGVEVRSLWIDAPAENGAENTGTRAQSTGTRAQPASAPQDVMSKEDWRRKDDAIHKMACVKTAADALKHTVPSDPSNEDLARFLERVALLSNAWLRGVLAVRDDPAGEDIPFG